MKLLRLLYHLGIHGLGAGMQIASWFHPKAKLWVEGRRQGLSYLESRRKAGDSWWWFHCASLGEFEQGRNLIEKIKAEHPQLKILLTFYSPSGYEIRKNYPQADAVMYLPLDTSRQVKAFLEMLQPAGVVFVKYELWLNMLQALRERGCPHWLISARVGADSAFLKSPLAALYREAFEGFQQIFVQDLESQRLLSAFAPQAEVQLSADTRFDRVAANRKQFQALPEIVAFVEQKTCLVGGSTWPKGERLIFEAWNRLALAERDDVCLILAPHEIHQDRIQQWIDRFPELSIRYSDIHRLSPAHRILWIDNIGMLSRLYAYADLSYVGGGWGTGLHNILEPAAFGSPVIIGPKHQRFPEAADLIQAGGCFAVKDGESLTRRVKSLLENPDLRQKIRENNLAFVQERTGATAKIYDWLRNEGLFSA